MHVRFFRNPRTAATTVGALVLLALAGCARGLPPAPTPDQARQHLTAALDAWKQGETPEGLASVSSPIQVIDHDWSGGSSLIDYRLEGEGHELGLNIQQGVALELKDPRGRTIRKTVDYVVSTGRHPVVARQDIDD